MTDNEHGAETPAGLSQNASAALPVGDSQPTRQTFRRAGRGRRFRPAARRPSRPTTTPGSAQPAGSTPATAVAAAPEPCLGVGETTSLAAAPERSSSNELTLAESRPTTPPPEEAVPPPPTSTETAISAAEGNASESEAMPPVPAYSPSPSGELASEPITPPAPLRKPAESASMAQAIQQVERIVENLKVALDEMQEVEAVLEQIREERTADERQLVALQNALRQLQQATSPGADLPVAADQAGQETRPLDSREMHGQSGQPPHRPYRDRDPRGFRRRHRGRGFRRPPGPPRFPSEGSAQNPDSSALSDSPQQNAEANAAPPSPPPTSAEAESP